MVYSKFKSNLSIQFICEDTYKDTIPLPYSASSKTPSWFTSTPNIDHSKCPFHLLFSGAQDISKKTNIKTCPAVTDYLNTGYIIPAWTNFMVRRIQDRLYWSWEHDFLTKYSCHLRDDEFSGFTPEQEPKDGVFHKFDSPWRIKTSPGVSCLVTHPYWVRENRYTTVSGVIHTDKIPMPIHWFFEWNAEVPNSLDRTQLPAAHNIISKSTPLVLIIPFIRSQFKLSYDFKPHAELQQISNQYAHGFLDWKGKSFYNSFRSSLKKFFT